MKNDLLHELEWRGFIYQCSDMDGLSARLNEKKMTGYWGTDPTGDSLHVGHLASLMLMRWFRNYGHRPIGLVGGATGRIGDPSMRDTSRPMLTEAQLKTNLAGLRKSITKIIGGGETLMVDNYDWSKKIGHMEWLAEYGAAFTVPHMLSMESVKKRLETGMTFLEFNYMTMQAVDFLELYRAHDCEIQFCGADQWGNCIMGIDLIRKKMAAPAFVLSTPLITDSRGEKIGKSAGNAVWVNEDKTTPYEYWQYFRNVADADVEKFLKIFTEIPRDEIARLSSLRDAELNEAKKVLAFHATKIAHGEDAAVAAERAAESVFAGDGAGAPELKIRATLPMAAIDFAMLTGLFSSKTEARRTIEQGGLSIAGSRVASADQVVLPAPELLVQKGKKTFIKVLINN
ncbi:MAG: tyrosine--tRNA ligase [Rickettsiales bacterium]|jgi:tyrosyl-tRNA synthetase|nr:tyrosine--tRNA ligase [Rickettsiales bacterium]